MVQTISWCPVEAACSHQHQVCSVITNLGCSGPVHQNAWAHYRCRRRPRPTRALHLYELSAFSSMSLVILKQKNAVDTQQHFRMMVIADSNQYYNAWPHLSARGHCIFFPLLVNRICVPSFMKWFRSRAAKSSMKNLLAHHFPITQDFCCHFFACSERTNRSKFYALQSKICSRIATNFAVLRNMLSVHRIWWTTDEKSSSRRSGSWIVRVLSCVDYLAKLSTTKGLLSIPGRGPFEQE